MSTPPAPVVGTGDVDWAHVTRTLRALGYAGAIGLEYFPTLPMDESLAQSRRMLAD